MLCGVVGTSQMRNTRFMHTRLLQCSTVIFGLSCSHEIPNDYTSPCGLAELTIALRSFNWCEICPGLLMKQILWTECARFNWVLHWLTRIMPEVSTRSLLSSQCSAVKEEPNAACDLPCNSLRCSDLANITKKLLAFEHKHSANDRDPMLTSPLHSIPTSCQSQPPQTHARSDTSVFLRRRVLRSTIG